ncbi:MAG TPA: serine/threonine-protein kinase, partial [Nannocystaceae bacterium]|nr:serine/threonine-protein kinase [Nannocystaceae bacterium]
MGSDDAADVSTPQDREGVETRRMRGALKEALFDRPQIPVRVGRFVVVDPIGEGGMGMVWRAFDPDLDRRVAVKLLRRAVDDTDERATARLVREAKAMAQLNHPNVCTVHEVGVHEGQVFVAMEYVDGGTLASWCGEHPRGTVARTAALVRLFEQAARGLAAAHAAGVVHRDVKPANMLVDRAGRLRIADFGLAGGTIGLPRGDVDAESTERSIDGAHVVGTPAYMAPEQFEGLADAKSDQFGLCASFFEACFGALPFAGANATARCTEIIAGRIREPAPGHAVPGWLRAVMVRGLQADPAARWSSVDALADALVRGDRSRRRKLGALALGLASTTVVGAWWLAPGSDPCVD